VSKTLKWIIGVAVGAVVVVSAGTYVFLHFIEGDAPAPLSLSSAPSTTTAGAPTPAGASDVSLEGNWTPTAQSVFGYRVKEVLFGQSQEAAGRTNKVTGSLVIAGDKVTATDLTVDMASVASDKGQRDSQFRGRIMNVSSFPTATFKLSEPIAITSTDTTFSGKATGDLTLRGTTKRVTFDIKAQKDGPQFKVNGSIPITFADWNIPNPSNIAASTEDHGILEFLVVFQKAA
jgi:polyisoprenoid-binding protein YceI